MTDLKRDRASNSRTNDYTRPPDDDATLASLSPRDKPWDKHRYHADKVTKLYAGSEFQQYSTRVHFCSQILEFGFGMTDSDSLRLKLKNARFCRVRHCPICQWRRSLRHKALFYRVIPKVWQDYPDHRWLFLTLTQKNIPIKELKVELQKMHKAFRRMTQLKSWPAVGWLRSAEVTKEKKRAMMAHPHYHCLLMVSPGYFAGKNYLSQKKWSKIWQRSMKLDYEPMVDVRAVKQGDTPMALVPELLKYCTKESDLVADREWFLELTRQMYRVRCLATGGALKEHLSKLEDEPEDLVGEGDGVLEDFASVYFGWNPEIHKYKLQ